MHRISINIPKQDAGDAEQLQGVDIDSSVGTPSDGDIIVYRSSGSDWVLEAKPAGGSNPAWGDITGTLSAQTDLQAAIDAKAASGDNVSIFTNDAGYITATLTQEQVEDFVGAMLSGNTESGITVTYQDADGTIDFAVDSQTEENFTTVLKNKLDAIEASANVTDTANVTAAGALMDSEVDADIKTLSLPANTTISAFGATLVDDADASAARTTLGVDASGTDNSTPVTLAGTGTYLSLSGQEITVDPITESDISDLDTYAKAGGLTLRYVPFASTADGVTLTDGPMYYNPITGYLGFNTTSPASFFHTYQNDSEVGAGGGITIEQDGAGDATLQFLLTAAKRWVVGIDNSDGDKFKISNSADIGTGTQITLDGSGLDVTGTLDATGAVTGSNLSGTNTGDEPSASTTVAGIAELATASETTTGTDTGRTITPDGLAGSDFGKRSISVLINDSTALTSGDGKAYVRIPDFIGGMNLVGAYASRAAGTGTPTIQVYNVTQTQDMLSTRITIDSGETDSSTAATAPVINTSNDDVAEGDRLRIDVDDAGTSTTWCEVQLVFQLP